MTSDPWHTVRHATESDLDAVLDIFSAVAAEGRWIATEMPFDRAQRREQWRAMLAKSDAAIFVACMDETISGHLGARMPWPGLVEIGMCVASDQRSSGAGSALLGACIAWAQEIGAHKIALEVFPENARARRLYAKFGFVEEGYFRAHLRRRDGELRDSIPMGLLLPPTPSP